MRTLAAALAVAVVSLVSAAHAATLGISLNQGGVYDVGDTIEITVTGDSEGAAAQNIFGKLVFSNPAVADVASGAPSQNTLLLFGSIPWDVAPLSCESSSCNLFNQVAPSIVPQTASNLLVATVSLLATAPGTSELSWSTALDGFQLTFFGLTDAPGAGITVVPEPTTAALLGLGIAGLAAARRRSF